jgi:lipopolysaccharide/colanic/teichoic acid biosynthesis glycosyltransferase/glycosyltransferase involved in cell wall biosynthesis
MSDADRPRVVHVTTVDMSVRHLLLNQLLWLRDAGFDVAAASAAGPDLEPVRRAAVTHFAVPFTRRVTPIADLKALVALWQLFRREHFTIVHTHQVKAALYAQLAARLARVPIVVNTVHGFYFHDSTPRFKRTAWILLERALARLSHALLSQNREDIGTAIREGICDPARIQHIGNGIDVCRFDRDTVDPRRLDALRRELGLTSGNQVVGFVGRLVVEKGVLELFEAVRLLKDRFPRLRLLMVGPVDSDRADAIRPSTAASCGVGDRTVFTGYRHDVPELYALMNVCVLPSHREGMPRSPMEAAAMGIPCVATAIRGCREVVRDGETGLLVPVNDAPALADGIARILGDEATAARMGGRARQVACEQFDERLVFERVRLAYDRLLRGRPAASPSRVKRAADLVAAGALLLLLLPVFAVVAAAVRVALGSPVLFRQMRPGLHGRPFQLLKFRTLREARGPDGEMLPDAQRMTRLGRWLRRTSLDELPELFNVLRGEMSLVGPRPLLMQYLARYTPRQARRHDVLPGITGLAQVSGRNQLSWEERFDLDVWYVDHRSLWLDLRILLRTAGKVVIGEGVSQPGHETAAEFMGSPAGTQTRQTHGS